jgi:tripartite-type tricarboxylate transporter receptor subunit TctC
MADLTAGIVADRMKASLGQPVIVENVPGSGGSIGAGRVAHATADGYTLACGSWGTHVVNGAILPLTYDVVSDFAPVSLLTNQPLVIATRATVPAKNLGELIAWLKARPVVASAGTAGAGGVTHLAEILFQSMTGTRLQLVPIAAARPRCRIWWPGASTCSSRRPRPHCRRSAPAPSRRSPSRQRAG